MSILGHNIKSLVRYSNLSQKDFAKKHELSETQLSKFISGKQEPSYSVLIDLAVTYNFCLVKFGTEKIERHFAAWNKGKSTAPIEVTKERDILTDSLNYIKEIGDKNSSNITILIKVLSQIVLEMEQNHEEVLSEIKILNKKKV